jgi:hypothetical protein
MTSKPLLVCMLLSVAASIGAMDFEFAPRMIKTWSKTQLLAQSLTLNISRDAVEFKGDFSFQCADSSDVIVPFYGAHTKGAPLSVTSADKALAEVKSVFVEDDTDAAKKQSRYDAEVERGAAIREAFYAYMGLSVPRSSFRQQAVAPHYYPWRAFTLKPQRDGQKTNLSISAKLAPVALPASEQGAVYAFEIPLRLTRFFGTSAGTITVTATLAPDLKPTDIAWITPASAKLAGNAITLTIDNEHPAEDLVIVMKGAMPKAAVPAK